MFFYCNSFEFGTKNYEIQFRDFIPCKGFICLIDAYSRFVFVQKTKSKKNEELEKRFKTLFKRSGPFNTGNSQKLLSLVTTILLLEGIENSLAKFS